MMDGWMFSLTLLLVATLRETEMILVVGVTAAPTVIRLYHFSSKVSIMSGLLFYTIYGQHVDSLCRKA